jgi:hypothetical protein
MPWRYHGHATVDPSNPAAFGTCDRCGFLFNLKDLVPEVQYNGTGLYRTGFLVCERTCFDTPNPQQLSPILPPDPLPVLNPRVEPYYLDEVDVLTSDGTTPIVTGDDDTPLVTDQPSENFSLPPGE